VLPLSHLTSCTHTKSNLYLANSLAAAVSVPALYRLLTFHVPNKMSLFLLRYKHSPSWRSEWGSSLPPDCFISRGTISPCEHFLTKVFNGDALLAPSPTCKLEDHPSSAVRDCLFNLFAATLLIGGRSPIRNLMTKSVATVNYNPWLVLLLHVSLCRWQRRQRKLPRRFCTLQHI